MKIIYKVSGMTCAGCSSTLQQKAAKLKGVQKVDVYLIDGILEMEVDNTFQEKELFKLVAKLGFSAVKEGDNNAENVEQIENTSHKFGYKQRFIWSLIFTIPLFYITMCHHHLHAPLPPFLENAANYGLAQLLLTIPILAVNYKFFTDGFKGLFTGNANMYSLITIGAVSATAYSLYILFKINLDPTNSMQLAMNQLFFEAAGTVLTFVTLGKWLEERSKQKSSAEIEKLLKLMPETVTVKEGQAWVQKKLAEVKINDILLIKKGENIPADGIVTSGYSFVDKSAITGESLPVEITVGDKVTSATINTGNAFEMQVEKIGQETLLSKIIYMVKNAGRSKAPIENLVDKISAIFVPVVLGLSLLTFTVWSIITACTTGFSFATALNYAITILVISCPCALGLATPLAIMVGSGKGASLGILYKNAEALQSFAKVDCILLDKTATITEGKLQVKHVEVLDKSLPYEEILSIIAGCEEQLKHPLAEAITSYVTEQNIPFTNVENVEYKVGKGATFDYKNKKYLLGNRKLLTHIDLTMIEQIQELEDAGKTVVLLADENKLLAYLAIADSIKTSSKEAIAACRAMGIEVAMLTGDTARVANVIAEQVGIERVYSDILPEDKLSIVQEHKKMGKVVMVGDGINDAPALKEADIGIAVGNGTDIAIDSADVVLARGDLMELVDGIQLSRATSRNIKENLFWAFIYNILAIPFAAGIFAFAGITLAPWMGALAMVLSDVFLVLNVLRLNYFKRKVTVKKQRKKVTISSK